MIPEGPPVTSRDSGGQVGGGTVIANNAISLSRQRAQQAVDYYNGNLRPARLGIAESNARRLQHNLHQQDTLYRSNSSLELVLDRELCSEPEGIRQHSGCRKSQYQRRECGRSSPIDTRPGVLRREYGSHGSIDVLSTSGSRAGGPGGATTGESFFAMLKDYRPAVLGAIGTDQRSPGPTEYLRVKVSDVPSDLLSSSSVALGVGSSSGHQEAGDATPPSVLALHRISLPCNVQATTSPKLKHKLQRLWGGSQAANSGCVASGSSKTQSSMSSAGGTAASTGLGSPASSAGGGGAMLSGDDSPANPTSGVVVASSSPDMEERQRRRAFAHYDCQSLTVNLGYAAKLRGLLLARRRNTTTGASAASMTGGRGGGGPSDADLAAASTAAADGEDAGDGRCNQLLQACPYFRNEIGGEQEREVSLSRLSGQDGPHLPAMAYGVSVLEPSPGGTLWKGSTCPYQKQQPRPVETRDAGALYYRHFFYGREHQNWFGLDEQLGPVAVSIRRERSEGAGGGGEAGPALFRLVVRTAELLTLRGAVFEDAVPGPTAGKAGGTVATKEVLEYVAPELQLSCLRLGITTQQCEEQLLKLDEQGLTSRYKVGIMYCKAGQGSEEDMYNNQESGPAFEEFLDTIGKRVRLKGFDKYRAGLDNKTDSTGTHSVYATHQDCEVMFHVSTLLPFTPNNRQQLLRKRHIGNDIVTIVFQEPDAQPFTPKHIRSQFQHVFIVVRVINPCSENTHYAVAVSRSKEVPVFGPPIKEDGIYSKGKSFVDFLLAKAINAENAAHRSEKFATMATRTRQEYLKDLANNYSTTTLVDTGQKFSLFSSIFPGRGVPARPAYTPSARQRGAACWQVLLHDPGRALPVDCLLGVSADTFVLLEEATRRIVFVTPCRNILGWSTTNQSSGLRVYHHQGECVTLRMRGADDRTDEQTEITARLRAVTLGHLAQELALRRNSSGQLGFHVQPDGIVTQVENNGLAWTAGLRQGARLVEICKVAVATLTHDQMVDLLKTSVLVTVTVIPPHSDGTSRRGCALANCKYTSCYYECDYENLMSSSSSTLSAEEDVMKGNSFAKSAGHKKGAQMQLKSNHRRKYERSFSPPRSSNSSGYGTGSSSKSFNNDPRFTINQDRSISSIHSDPKWYEALESSEHMGNSKTPSPVTSSLNFQNGTPKRHKLQASNSLPLQQANLTLANANVIDLEGTDEITMNGNNETNRPMPRTANIEYLHTGVKNEIQSMESVIDDALLASTNNSPQLKRSSKLRGTLTSRNGKQNIHPNSEAKLRNGVTSRHTNRHSANLNSTLQEDLMRLINPDYSLDESLSKKKESCSMVNISSISDNKKLRSTEKAAELLPQSLSNLSVKDSEEITNDGTVAEVIFTMARPATVISNTSTASSPNPYEMKLSKEERLSPRATVVAKKSASSGQIHLLKNLMVDVPTLADDQDMDWPSLVDTANRAMLQVKEDTDSTSMKNTSHTQVNAEACENDIAHSASVPELKNHLNLLESRVVRETQQRLNLEDEVRRLREENRRLQDESQTAAQQLQKFTEWFFHTIHRQ